MHRGAEKNKPERKRKLGREVRREKPGRLVASGKTVSAAFGRPANDIDLEFPDPTLEADFERHNSDIDVTAGAVAIVDPEVEEDSLPETLLARARPDYAEPVEVLPEPVEADDEADSEASGDAESEGESHAAPSVSPKADEPQSFLAMYFRDMAELSVLKPEQEFETARRIEELELELWHVLLGFAPWASHLVSLLEAAMAETLPDFKVYRLLSERVHRKAPSAEKRRLVKVIASLSGQIKELDIDRVFVDAALTELQRLRGAVRMKRPIEGLGFNTETKAFHEFAAAATKKSSVVKHAKNEFVKSNLRLVVSIARRFNHGRLPLPDLIQEGNIGLMKAVERYDYRRGFRFSTYASWWIRHAISRALADKGRAVRLPVHMIDAYHRIAKSERELQSKLERPATTEEIASVTGIEAEKLEKMRTFLADSPVSLDRSLSEDDGRRLIDVLVDPNEAPSPPEQMMNSETQQEMLKLLGGLKPIEADILRKRFGLINDHERTLKEIGDEYRLSRERVRQLQEQALGKMRKAMAKREIL